MMIHNLKLHYSHLLIIMVFLFFSKHLFAQEITMFDESLSYHYYEDDNRINVKRVEKLLSKDSIANLHWKRAKLKNFISNSFLITEIGMVTILTGSNSKKTRILASIGILASIVGTLTFAISRQKSKRKAIIRYNSLFDDSNKKKKKTTFKISPDLIHDINQKSSKGISLKMQW